MNIKKMINKIRCHHGKEYFNQDDLDGNYIIDLTNNILVIKNNSTSLIYYYYIPRQYNLYITFFISKPMNLIINNQINNSIINKLGFDKSGIIMPRIENDYTSFSAVNISNSNIKILNSNTIYNTLLFLNNKFESYIVDNYTVDNVDENYDFFSTNDILDNKTYNSISILDHSISKKNILKNELKNLIIIFNFIKKYQQPKFNINFDIEDDIINTNIINSKINNFFTYNNNIIITNLDNTNIFCINDSTHLIFKISPQQISEQRSARIISVNNNILNLGDFNNCSDLSFIQNQVIFPVTIIDNNGRYYILKSEKNNNSSIKIIDSIPNNPTHVFFPVIIGHFKQFLYDKIYGDLIMPTDIIEYASIFFEFV